MSINQVLMILIAAGAVVGGLDQILGNKLRLGSKFKDGLNYMGPTALCIAGILCLAPVIGAGCRMLLAPLFRAVSIDPAMSANILAVDMGGYALAMELADNAAIGLYSGLVVASTFGCTVVFLIPLGMAVVDPACRKAFSRGVMFGLVGMPAGLIVGGLLTGLTVTQTLWQSMPVFLVAVLLGLGLWKIPEKMALAFKVFANFISIVSVIGLVLGTVTYLTGWEIIPDLAPIEDAMTTVGTIGVVLIGSLPLTELLQRALRKPFGALGRKLGMNHVSMAGLLISLVNAIPVLTSMKDMDERGQVVNVAFSVCATSLLAAHLGFVTANAPEMLGAVLAAKAVGGIAAAAIAVLATKKKPVSAK